MSIQVTNMICLLDSMLLDVYSNVLDTVRSRGHIGKAKRVRY